MLKFKTVRGYAGYLAKIEGGKTEARIGDIHTILNLISDDIFQFAAKCNNIDPKDIEKMKAYAKKEKDYFNETSLDDMTHSAIMCVNGAKRYLASNKGKK